MFSIFFNKDRSKVYLAIVKYFFPKMVIFGVGDATLKVLGKMDSPLNSISILPDYWERT